MSKYTLYSTKADYEKIYESLKQIEQKSGEKFDWKKIKRTSYDMLQVLEHAMNRKLATLNK